MATVLLVSDNVILETLNRQALAAFQRATFTRILDTPSGEVGATLVEVSLTPEDFAIIRLADQFANSHGATPPIAVAEPQG